MIGDVVGEPGLRALERELPALIREQEADFVVVNGENAAEGFGMTEDAMKRILGAGADVITGGNHIWEKRDFLSVMNAGERVLRPANYPAGAAGRGWVRMEKAPRCGPPVSWLVINLQGREHMTALDCPFRCFDAIRGDSPAAGLLDLAGCIVLVDFHAESSREKEALGLYLDGRASLVAGTHTHVQTADERILPKGSAYITDLGMTGVQDSVIGMDIGICLNRARHQVLYRMEVASDGQGASVRGAAAEIDRQTGRALSIRRIA